MRIGQSTDIHAWTKDRPLILGGVHIPYDKGLLGHSDADALTHAIIEAIIGACALGDIGKHFPDTDPQYKGISSLKLLEMTTTLMKEQGYKLVNCDSLVLIEKPQLSPFIQQMRLNIAQAISCDLNQINIKATRGEKIGFVGREEGVVAQAIVLLERI